MSMPCAVFAQAFQGYTLYAPNNSSTTRLMNMSNTVVKTWTHTRSGGYSYYLLQDGSLLRTAMFGSSLNGGGAQGAVQRVAWNGTLLWEYTYSTTSYRAHHDIEPMPNGNVLIIAWEVKTAAQAVQAGLNHSAVIWPDHIIEVQPVGTTGGNIVWRWHAWDHLIQDYDPTKSNYGVVADHPELLDINVGSAGTGDWTHVNGISYNPELDQIVFSSHELDEIYVIDHSTTIEQAAGHTGGRWGKGGDILYRWGRPSNYRAPGAQVFNVVHCGSWIADSLPGAGHLMAFNNREGQGTSMIVELAAPVDTAGNYVWTPGTAFGPAAPVWSYTASGFYSNHLGGVQRLPNGNTLIAQSTSGRMFEVTSGGTVVWNYQPGGEVVRAWRYPPEYPGLAGLGLAAQFSVAPGSIFFGDVSVSSSKMDSVRVKNTGSLALTISSLASTNPSEFSIVETTPVVIPAGDSVRIHVVFHPTGGGAQTGRVRFTHSGTTSPDSIQLQGNGVNATQVVVPVLAGWNLISNPLTVTNDSVHTLYPGSVFNYAFMFVPASGYSQSATMTNGKGYWGKFAASGSNPIIGEMRQQDSIHVVAGWNLIGTIAAPVDTGAIVSVPAGLRSSDWFGYSETGYTSAPLLVPGKAYWVKANEAGVFILAAPSWKQEVK